MYQRILIIAFSCFIFTLQGLTQEEYLLKIDSIKQATETYKVVETMPRFPGCEEIEGTDKEKKACADKKMLEYLYSNIKYPDTARENGIEGTVVIQFVIEKDGEIVDARIVRDIGSGCGEEALRVVNAMEQLEEKWVSGKQRGQPVRVQYNLPVKFLLDRGSKDLTVIHHLTDPNIDPNQPAKLIFIRSTGFQGGGVPFNIFMDNEIFCKLKNKRYSTHEISPGKHEILMQFRGKTPKKNSKKQRVSIIPGNTYYFELIIRTGGPSWYILDFREIQENTAKKLMGSIKETNCN